MMKNFLTKLNLAIVTIAVALVSFAERQPYERYQTIVERQMFGPPPEGFDPSKRPSEVKGGREDRKAEQELTKEQEKLKSSIRFSMINVTPDGETAVGFTDSSNAKNPKNYYLKVGETRGGWTVKKADSIEGTMTIVKGDIEVELSLGGDSAKGAGKTSSASARTRGAADASGAAPRLGSLSARRQQRQAQREAKEARMAAMMKALEENKAADEQRRAEEAKRREQEKADREAERQEQQAKLKDLAEQLKRAREERESKNAEEPAKSDDEQAEE